MITCFVKKWIACLNIIQTSFNLIIVQNISRYLQYCRQKRIDKVYFRLPITCLRQGIVHFIACNALTQRFYHQKCANPKLFTDYAFKRPKYSLKLTSSDKFSFFRNLDRLTSMLLGITFKILAISLEDKFIIR